MPNLFQPITIGQMELKNRILMAPLTRGRADAEGAVPNDLMAEHYAQRASAGLIIAEATAISPLGYGWHKAPGIWSEAHVKGWQKTTQAVHAKGGKIVLQLWHMGRVSHPDFQQGELPVGPSAIAAEGEARSTPSGEEKPYITPRAMDQADITNTVKDYARAAKQAIEAGFDGVEVHAANGYLLDQFIRDGSNQRSDAFGGSIANRWKFPLMAVEAVAQAIGAERTGVRLSPVNPFNSMSDNDPIASFTYGAQQLNAFKLAYLHVMEALPSHPFGVADPVVHPHIRAAYEGILILNGARGQAEATEGLKKGEADAYAFGVPFLANPDLPARYTNNTALNTPNQALFYQGGAEGYTDYPFLAEAA